MSFWTDYFDNITINDDLHEVEQEIRNISQVLNATLSKKVFHPDSHPVWEFILFGGILVLIVLSCLLNLLCGVCLCKLSRDNVLLKYRLDNSVTLSEIPSMIARRIQREINENESVDFSGGRYIANQNYSPPPESSDRRSSNGVLDVVTSAQIHSPPKDFVDGVVDQSPALPEGKHLGSQRSDENVEHEHGTGADAEPHANVLGGLQDNPEIYPPPPPFSVSPSVRYKNGSDRVIFKVLEEHPDYVHAGEVVEDFIDFAEGDDVELAEVSVVTMPPAMPVNDQLSKSLEVLRSDRFGGFESGIEHDEEFYENHSSYYVRIFEEPVLSNLQK